MEIDRRPPSSAWSGARSRRPPVRVGGACRMPERGGGAEMLDGSPAEIAARIVEIVRERMAG